MSEKRKINLGNTLTKITLLFMFSVAVVCIVSSNNNSMLNESNQSIANTSFLPNSSSNNSVNYHVTNNTTPTGLNSSSNVSCNHSITNLNVSNPTTTSTVPVINQVSEELSITEINSIVCGDDEINGLKPRGKQKNG